MVQSKLCNLLSLTFIYFMVFKSHKKYKYSKLKHNLINVMCNKDICLCGFPEVKNIKVFMFLKYFGLTLTFLFVKSDFLLFSISWKFNNNKCFLCFNIYMIQFVIYNLKSLLLSAIVRKKQPQIICNSYGCCCVQ